MIVAADSDHSESDMPFDRFHAVVVVAVAGVGPDASADH